MLEPEDKPLTTLEACAQRGERKGAMLAERLRPVRSSILILSALASRRLDRLVHVERKHGRIGFNVELDGPVYVYGMAGSKVRDRLRYAVS